MKANPVRGVNAGVLPVSALQYFWPMQVRTLMFGLLLAQLADAATFTIGVALHGIGLEGNGIAVALYQLRGLEGVLWAKAAVIVVTLAILVLGAGRFPRLILFGSATATSMGLLGVVTNVLSLAILAG